MKGGQPIREGDQVVGGIGINADTLARDDEIALAALSAVGRYLFPVSATLRWH